MNIFVLQSHDEIVEAVKAIHERAVSSHAVRRCCQRRGNRESLADHTIGARGADCGHPAGSKLIVDGSQITQQVVSVNLPQNHEEIVEVEEADRGLHRATESRGNRGCCANHYRRNS